MDKYRTNTAGHLINGVFMRTAAYTLLPHNGGQFSRSSAADKFRGLSAAEERRNSPLCELFIV